MNQSERRTLDRADKEAFDRDGYYVAKGLFIPEEIDTLRNHYMDLHARGPIPGYFDPKPLEQCGGDILHHYPRMMHPHRYDNVSKQYMLDARLRDVLHDLYGEEPLAAQSMLYFKPPGARGQALHQDNFYLQVSPGTCMAAWVPLDDTDEENGGLFVAPGTGASDIQCPHVADLTQSFTVEEVDVPAGSQPIPIRLQRGDVLFFNGSLIHGSYPNASKERFRRAFICHYVPGSMTEMHEAYYPLHTFDGQPVRRDNAAEGSICGTEEWNTLKTAHEQLYSRPQDAVFA